MNVDVYLITGFLGSGKTTFLKNILTNEKNTAVIVNEIGKVGLDQIFLQDSSDNTVLLPNGCLCCEMIENLEHTLKVIVEQSCFERIVIETTGLALPSDIIRRINAYAKINSQIRFAGTLTLVDGKNSPNQLKQQQEWLSQVISADVLLMSKTDLISRDEQQDLLQILKKINSTALIDTVLDHHLSFDIFDKCRKNLENNKNNFNFFPILNRQEKHGNIETVSFTFNVALNWMKFSTWLALLLHRYGEKILRSKGILKFENYKELFVLHSVQNFVHDLEVMQKESAVSDFKFVMIVRDLDPKRIIASFEAFLGIDPKIMQVEYSNRI